jgi:hypothetical protein
MSDDKPGQPALAALRQIQTIAGAFAILGLIGLVVGYGADASVGKKAFWGSYLYGFIFWMGITLGCTTLTYLHHTIRAQWSLSILRVAEAGNKNLRWIWIPFAVLAFGAVGLHQVYPWADPEHLHELHPNKQQYLNPTAWLIRAVIYFAFWIGTTSYLNRSSLKQDETRDESLAQARSNRAPAWGVIHVVLLTFAYTDWMMSLDPMWFSTLYGAWHMASQLLSAIAFGTIIVVGLRLRRPFSEIVTPVLTKDLGNMMFGFTMVWGYFTLSQFLIIWSGNLPEEITFFVARFRGIGAILGAAIVAGQWLLPFLLLLSGRTKRTPHLLLFVAFWIFGFRMVDIWWQTIPFFRYDGFQPGDLVRDLAAVAGIGGVWVAAWVANYKKHALVASHDPRLMESKAALEAHGHG